MRHGSNGSAASGEYGNVLSVPVAMAGPRDAEPAYGDEHSDRLLVALGFYIHDLKNPLTSIKLLAAIAERRLRQGQPDHAKLLDEFRLLQVLSARAVKLTEQMHDLLRLEAGEPGSLTLAPTDLIELVRPIAAEYVHLTVQPIRVRARGRSIKGMWDAERLGCVVDNLLSNAVKYSPHGGPITVSVSAMASKAGVPMAMLRVRDQGVGIAAADLPHVFKRFFRGTTPVPVRGSGIGLAAVADIVRAHGGEVRVTSRHGRGTVVTVLLPYSTGGIPDR